MNFLKSISFGYLNSSSTDKRSLDQFFSEEEEETTTTKKLCTSDFISESTLKDKTLINGDYDDCEDEELDSVSEWETSSSSSSEELLNCDDDYNEEDLNTASPFESSSSNDDRDLQLNQVPQSGIPVPTNLRIRFIADPAKTMKLLLSIKDDSQIPSSCTSPTFHSDGSLGLTFDREEEAKSLRAILSVNGFHVEMSKNLESRIEVRGVPASVTNRTIARAARGIFLYSTETTNSAATRTVMLAVAPETYHQLVTSQYLQVSRLIKFHVAPYGSDQVNPDGVIEIAEEDETVDDFSARTQPIHIEVQDKSGDTLVTDVKDLVKFITAQDCIKWRLSKIDLEMDKESEVGEERVNEESNPKDEQESKSEEGKEQASQSKKITSRLLRRVQELNQSATAYCGDSDLSPSSQSASQSRKESLRSGKQVFTYSDSLSFNRWISSSSSSNISTSGSKAQPRKSLRSRKKVTKYSDSSTVSSSKPSSSGNKQPKKSQVSSKSNIRPSTSKQYPCPKCGQQFLFQQVMSRHVRTCQAKPAPSANVKCPICAKSFVNKSELVNRHMRVCFEQNMPSVSTKEEEEEGILKVPRVVGGPKYNFKCKCGKQFQKKEYLELHRSRPYKAGDGFQCGQCFYTYSCLRDIKLHHYSVHLGGQLFECPECGQLFTSKHSMVRHCRMERAQPETKCLYCGRSFSGNFKLKQHLRACKKRPRISHLPNRATAGFDWKIEHFFS